MTTIEKCARAIAEGLGDNYDHAFANKSEWNAARGEKGDRFRAIFEPFRSDFEDAATAVLTALLEPSESLFATVIPEPVHLYGDGLRGAPYQRVMKNAVMVERAALASRFREVIRAALDEVRG